MKKIIYYGFLIFLVFFCSYYGFRIYHQQKKYQQGEKMYQNIQEYMNITKTPFDSEDSNLTISENQIEKINYIVIDWKSLKEINTDTIGWIYCPNTSLNYPILKSSDNQDYLNTTITGEKNSVGSIFLDYRNTSDFSDFLSMIYGHNMKNGTMFKTINQYQKESYYQEHPIIYIGNEKNMNTFGIISVLHLSEQDEIYQNLHLSKKEYQEFLKTYTKKSLYTTNQIYSTEKQTIALSTCDKKGYRIVILLQKI